MQESSPAFTNKSIVNPGEIIPLGRLAAVAMLYLGFPLALFFAGWLKIPLAVPLLLALVYAYVLLWRNCHADTVPFRFKRIHFILFIVALVWASFGGAGHIFYANRFDWALRDAVLHDLTVASWPPGYDIGDGALWLLRCPLGFYLPSALAGKIFGLPAADIVLWLWTVIGIWVFLLLLPIDKNRLWKIGVAVLIVVFFSGMDIVGWWILRGNNPPLYQHLEWWARLYQYSSNTSALVWTPNHTLPGWIAAALFWRHWKTDRFISIAPLLLAFLPLWSPFPMIGILPFYLLLLFRVFFENKWKAISWPLLIISLLIISIIGAFLSMDIGGIPKGSTIGAYNETSVLIAVYVCFILIEFLALCAFLRSSCRSPLFRIAIAFLLLLPFFRFGPSNDLAMRGSIPAIMFLCIATIEALQRPAMLSRKAMIGCCVVLILGAMTPIHEFYRAATLPYWKLDPTVNVMSYDLLPPPHYVAGIQSNWRWILFRHPGQIIKTGLLNKQPRLLPQEYP